MARTHLLLCATTVLAGLGLSGLAPAHAGPNMPNISVPNISAPRLEFNIRAPNVLRDRDVASLRDPATAENKSKNGKKQSDKKGNDIASHGKAGSGAAHKAVRRPRGHKPLQSEGRGVIPGDGPVFDNLRDHLDKIGTNAAEYRHIKELVELLVAGQLAAGHVPGDSDRSAADPKGDLKSRFSHAINPQASDNTGWSDLEKFSDAPHYGGGGSRHGHSGGIFGWGPGGAPAPFRDPSGQVSNDWHLVTRTSGGRVTREYWKNYETGQTYTSTRTTTSYGYRTTEATYTPGHGTEIVVLHTGAENPGDSEGQPTFEPEPHQDVVIKEAIVITATGAPGGGIQGASEGTGGSGNSPDGQPVAEGAGRPSGSGYEVALHLRGGRRIVCDLFGCREGASTSGIIGDPGRNNPDGTSVVGASSGPSTGPGAATDPCPDCGPSGSGGNPPRDPRPSDAGWTGPGGGGVEGGGPPVPRGSGS